MSRRIDFILVYQSTLPPSSRSVMTHVHPSRSQSLKTVPLLTTIQAFLFLSSLSSLYCLHVPTAPHAPLSSTSQRSWLTISSSLMAFHGGKSISFSGYGFLPPPRSGGNRVGVFPPFFAARGLFRGSSLAKMGWVECRSFSGKKAACFVGGTRRELAMRRVVGDDGGGSIRKCSLFRSSRSYSLFTQSWRSISAKVRGIVILMHGLNEHSSRYDRFAKQLNANGFHVYAVDWIGHGGSDGLHAYVHSLDAVVEDTKEYLHKVLTEDPGFPCFCFGHSTGAAIILKVVLDPKVHELVAGIVLTSPAIIVQPSHPILLLLAPVLSLILPKHQFDAAHKPGLPVCRDPDALVEKYADPLVYTGSIRVRTGVEILHICNYLQQNLRKVVTPFFVLHGAADTVTDPEGSQKLYVEAASADKSIKLYDGLLHDLLFEPEKKAVVEDIINWLVSKL